ncbi:very short patch repair endonuclease [Xanthobacter sediminis]
MKAAAPTTAERSRLMRQVRRRDTAPEVLVGRILRRLGLSYRKDVRGLPGTPDFANRSRRWAVFVNGCFWHRHTGCPRGAPPKSNIDFWAPKLARNRARDAQAIRALRRAGFTVAVVWECRIDEADDHLRRTVSKRDARSRAARN